MSDSPSPYKKCCGSGSDLTIKSRIYILILYPCSEQVGVNQWSHICIVFNSAVGEGGTYFTAGV